MINKENNNIKPIKVYRKDKIAEGSFRKVYNYQDKIVKINLNGKNKDGITTCFGNERELVSYQNMPEPLKKYFPKCYGRTRVQLFDVDDIFIDYYSYILTQGLVMEKIQNYDKSKAYTIAELFAQDEIYFLQETKEKILKQTKEMLFDFVKYNFYSTSFALDNIIVVIDAPYSLKIMGIDCKQQTHKEFIPIFKIPFLARLKLKRRAKRTLAQLENLFNNVM